ncbi:MAG: leucyl aminopeptidase [Thermodesulfobacteriota bacterium]
MKISVAKKELSSCKAHCLAIVIRQAETSDEVAQLPAELQDYLTAAWQAGDFNGKAGQTLLVYAPKLACQRLLFVGLGPEAGRDEVRQAGGTIAKAVAGLKVSQLAIGWQEEILPGLDMGECLAEGVFLGAYTFTKYKAAPEKERVELKKITLYPAGENSSCRKGVRLAQVAARAANLARDMANEPGNRWTPEEFALAGRSLGQKGLTCKVLTKRELQRLKMGGILGVNQGSSEPPCLVVLEYNCGAAKADTLLLVGKGLTFDAGGISLKPAAGMEDMKYDMCGGAAVMAAMTAVAEEQPKGVNVVALVPATENLPSSSALKPGDVITAYNGTTIEVINTDAEGRLILADALAYGIEKFKPTAVIDLATLTGAVIVGLGHHRCGLLSNDDELAQKVAAAGEQSGEPCWRLPLGKEYSKQLESQVADLKNIGGKAAGTITAAAFLQEFVGATPWVHLDIAGTAWGFTEKSYVPAKGPSGFGARLLVELIRGWR